MVLSIYDLNCLLSREINMSCVKDYLVMKPRQPTLQVCQFVKYVPLSVNEQIQFMLKSEKGSSVWFCMLASDRVAF